MLKSFVFTLITLFSMIEGCKLCAHKSKETKEKFSIGMTGYHTSTKGEVLGQLSHCTSSDPKVATATQYSNSGAFAQTLGIAPGKATIKCYQIEPESKSPTLWYQGQATVEKNMVTCSSDGHNINFTSNTVCSPNSVCCNPQSGGGYLCICGSNTCPNCPCTQEFDAHHIPDGEVSCQD